MVKPSFNLLLIFILIVFLVFLFGFTYLFGIVVLEDDHYVGKVKEIKTVSVGGVGASDMALVVLDNGRELIVNGNGVDDLEIGSEVWTANQYSYNYRVKK